MVIVTKSLSDWPVPHGPQQHNNPQVWNYGHADWTGLNWDLINLECFWWFTKTYLGGNNPESQGCLFAWIGQLGRHVPHGPQLQNNNNNNIGFGNYGHEEWSRLNWVLINLECFGDSQNLRFTKPKLGGNNQRARDGYSPNRHLVLGDQARSRMITWHCAFCILTPIFKHQRTVLEPIPVRALRGRIVT